MEGLICALLVLSEPLRCWAQYLHVNAAWVIHKARRELSCCFYIMWMEIFWNEGEKNSNCCHCLLNPTFSFQDTTNHCTFLWITSFLPVWSTATLPLSLLQAHCWSTSWNLCTLPTPPAQQAQGTVQRINWRLLAGQISHPSSSWSVHFVLILTKYSFVSVGFTVIWCNFQNDNVYSKVTCVKIGHEKKWIIHRT